MVDGTSATDRATNIHATDNHPCTDSFVQLYVFADIAIGDILVDQGLVKVMINWRGKQYCVVGRLV